MTKTEISKVLATAANIAAENANAHHPVALAAAMQYAIEGAADTLVILRDLGIIEWEGYPKK